MGRRGKKTEKPPVSLRDAPDAAEIARELIQEHHKHLVGVRVDCAFRNETLKTKGRRVLGTASRTTTREEYLGRRKRAADGTFQSPEHYFLLVFAEPEWKLLSDPQRRALVDHELCHCWKKVKDDGSEVLTLLPHDIEEFSSVVARHGLWKKDLDAFANAARPHMQMTLEIVDGGTGAALVDRHTGEIVEQAQAAS